MGRKKYSRELKAQIALDAIKGQKTIAELASEYGVHANQISSWKKHFFEHGSRTFDGVEKIKVSSQEEKILALEQKLQTKNEVLSELMEEHLKLKKNFGEV